MVGFQSFFTDEPEQERVRGLGADDGGWRIKPSSILDDEADDRVPAFRQAWKQGAGLSDLFGGDPFKLHGSVGASGADNHRPDVVKVETFLHRTGHYRPLTEDGPSGWHNDSLDKGIRSFQRENALKIDGLLKPGGPTITALGGRLGGKMSEQTGATANVLSGEHDGMDGIGGPLGQAKPPKPDEPRLPHFPTPPRLDTPEARLQALFDIAGTLGGRIFGQDRPGERPRPPLPPTSAADYDLDPPTTLPVQKPQSTKPMPGDGAGPMGMMPPAPPTQEEMDRYNTEYQAWLKENWEKIQQNKELVAQGYPPQSIPKPPRKPGEPLPGVRYARPATSGPTAPKPADPFPGHTISEAGAGEHDNWARNVLTRDSDPRQTANFLKNVIKDHGDQGRGDVADLLGRFDAIDPDKANALHGALKQVSGEDLPLRIAPLGQGFREPSLEERLAKAPKSPFGSTEGADMFAAEGMAKALLKRGDYQDPIRHFFKGEMAKNDSATMPYLAAVHDVMRQKDPEAAMKFATQMQEAGLAKVEEAKPVQTAQVNTGTTTDATPPTSPTQPSTTTAAKPQDGGVRSPVPNPTRRDDDRGGGHFGADRDNGKRTHKGLDLEASPGTEVGSPVGGKVVGVNNAYKNDPYNGEFTSVRVEGNDGRIYDLRYVTPNGPDGKPMVKIGDRVEAGQTVGSVQNRARHTPGMDNHIHVEIRDREGNQIDPEPEIRPAPPRRRKK